MNKPREKWYRQNGAEGDVVISTRVRLARNLTGVPFPASMNPEQKQSVVEAVCAALQPVEETFQLADMGKLSPRDALSLVERHLISPEFARSGAGSALLLTEDEGTALMVNEEDHLRLQVMRPGLDLDGAYEQADRLDTVLDETLHFAFDQRLGYLTQCPTNLGTGMRASLMLHLPALQERGAHPAAGGDRLQAGAHHPRHVRRGHQATRRDLSAVQSGDAGNFGAGGHRQPEGYRRPDYPGGAGRTGAMEAESPL